MGFVSQSTFRILFALFFMLQICLSAIIYPSEYLITSPEQQFRTLRSRIERRDTPCLINAGLSQGCDLSDILYAKYQANKFSSFASPGRR